MLESKNHDLKVGESVRIKRGFMTSYVLVYAGMPSQSVFSLVLTTTAGHMGMGYNLYFSADRRLLEVAGVPVTVQAVSPTGIQLSLNER